MCIVVLCVFVCSQNRSACCVKVVALSSPLPEAGVGFGRLTGKEVKGWGRSQILELLEKHGKRCESTVTKIT